MLGFVGLHSRPVVGDGDHRIGVVSVHPDPSGRTGGGVRPHVPQKIVHHLTQGGGVPHHLDGARRLEGDRPVGAHRGCGVNRLGTQGHQVHRPPFHRSALVQSGQQEEVRHQVFHAGRLGADPPHQPLEVLLLLGGPPPEQLGVGGDGGDRGAQFVRCVGHEPAQSLFGSPQLILRGDPGAERGFDPGQHHVERAGQATHLGGVVLSRHPLGQVACGDRLGGRLHLAQGAQTDADQPQSARQRDQHRAAGHRQLDQEQSVQCAPDLAQRLGQDEQVPVVEDGGPHPERGATGLFGGRREVGGLLAVGRGRESGHRVGDHRGVVGAVHVGRAGL